MRCTGDAASEKRSAATLRTRLEQAAGMTSYDLCLAWNWKYDADFVLLLDRACAARRLSLLQVTPENLGDVLRCLLDEQVGFRAFFDRASEDDARFVAVVQWASKHGAYRINPHELAARSSDKAAMHLALIGAGLYTPYTIILPSYDQQPDIAPVDLRPLGGRFTIKPAHGGGGRGVVTDATSLGQALVARREFPADKYLLQTQIVPRKLDGRWAWFRVIYCAGQVYACWWDRQTHIYGLVAPADECRYGLGPLREAATSIARLCGLHLFSTEIALSSEDLFVVVDYVNDQIDLRLQSSVADGVPDDIVRQVAERLAEVVAALGLPSSGCEGGAHD